MSKDIMDIAAAQGQALVGYGNFALGLANHIVNVKQNRRNLQAVERQNALAAAESEKAYQRSLPTTQVANMRRAGMSQAGAINALNGGGSYTPAPVAAGQEQIYDFSGMQDALANIAQVGLANAQLKEQKRQFDANLGLEKEKLQLEKDKHEDSVRVNTATINKLEAETGVTNIEKSLLSIEEEISKANKDGRLETEKLRNVAEQANYVLSKFRDDKIINAYNTLSPDELEQIFELQAYLSLVEHGLKHDSMSAIYEGGKKIVSWLGKSKGAGKNIRSN